MMYQNYKKLEKATTDMVVMYVELMQQFDDGNTVLGTEEAKAMECCVRMMSAYMGMIKEEAQIMDRLNKVLEKLEEKEKES